MLNELKNLADSISAAGFSGEDWDDRFKEIKVKGSPCFVLSLSEHGEIGDIRFIEPNNAKVLRTWQGGSNGECFPCFNFTPFYELVEDKKNPLSPAKKNDAIKDFVKTFLSTEEIPMEVGSIHLASRTKADAKTAKCLGIIANRFFQTMTHNVGAADPLVKLKDALSKLCGNEKVAEAFNRNLLSYIRKHLTPEMALQKDVSTVWSLLFQKTQDVVIFFDIVEADCFQIASERAMKVINNRLLAANGGMSTTSDSKFETDAFGMSCLQEELLGKFPEVKLPGAIAVTKLRSMNGESKCQMRYGRIDAESFPVGSTARKETKAALTWISSSEREGKTWAVAGANELVFAYPKTIPSAPPLLARLFGNGRSSTEEDESRMIRFEKYAEDALNGIKKLVEKNTSNTEIEVFAIQKADKARRKVVFYRNYSLARLEEAVSSWLAGTQNIPFIRILKWPQKNKGEKVTKEIKPIPLEFLAPLPLVSTSITYAVWVQDGNEKFEPKYRFAPLYEGYPVFNGLELFIGEAISTGLAERMLSLLLQGSASLCVSVGNLSHRYKDNIVANGRAVTHLEYALPLLGIILHKLNHKKEIYMEKTPYLIGRFLNLADGLHALWCHNVKKNDPLPPQLLGSSLYASFQINPIQAFANAGLRLKPYLDWAKTNQTEDSKLSRWFVGEFGRITGAIAAMGVPLHLSDADKAEMLLGYLASNEKSSKQKTDETLIN